MQVNSFNYRMEDKEMYAMVDNKTNHVWCFDDTFEDAKKALDRQPDPSYYRIEKVQAKDYFNLETGRLIHNKIEKQSIISSLNGKVDQASGSARTGEQIHKNEQVL